MGTYRVKHSFTAGELSPLMADRIDFKRFKNGCKKLYNAVCAVQGPATRRSGFKFIYDLNSLGMDPAAPDIRMIPFIFNEIQAYAMIFFMHTDGDPRLVFGTTNASNEDGLVLGTGEACDYENTIKQDYVVAETEYAFDNASGSSVNTLVVTYTDQADPPVATELVDGTDYSWVVAGDTLTVTILIPQSTDGTLTFDVDLSSAVITEGDIVIVTLPTGYDIDGFDYAQSADEMYIAQGKNPPLILKRWGVDCWEVVEVTFTSQPTEWTDDNGWPERVTFHQQRLAFAANILRRQTVWISKAGDFSDFGVSTGVVASDAITFSLDSGTQNKIEWMTSLKSLNVGTLGNEWTVTGSDRSSLTPSNILSQRHTNNGSEPLKPLMIGLATMFLERHGRTVNEFKYDYTYDSYKTSDIAILSPHLTTHYSIIDWTYQQTPDSIIWCVREDGALLGITYQREHEIVGWHEHGTQGDFVATTAIPGKTREDDVWVVVKRVVESVDRYYVELMEDVFTGSTAAEGRFLDGFLTYSGVPQDVISGLGHLEGLTVDILADGAVHPSRVVASGSVTLNNEYSDVVIGLGYVTEIRPNLADVSRQDGSSLGRVQRITSIAVDFYNSLGCTFGTYNQEDGEQEEEVPFRVPTDLMGQAVPLFTGWYDLDFMEGYDRQSDYFIRQKQPLPLTVRAVVDNVEIHE